MKRCLAAASCYLGHRRLFASEGHRKRENRPLSFCVLTEQLCFAAKRCAITRRWPQRSLQDSPGNIKQTDLYFYFLSSSDDKRRPSSKINSVIPRRWEEGGVSAAWPSASEADSSNGASDRRHQQESRQTLTGRRWVCKRQEHWPSLDPVMEAVMPATAAANTPGHPWLDAVQV